LNMNYEDIMQDIVLNADVDLAIMRKKERRIIMLIFKDNRPETVTSTFGNGYCARALVHGSWGFASTTREDQLQNTLERAEMLATHSRKYKNTEIELAPLIPSKGTWQSHGIVELGESTITELCELICVCQQEVMDQPSIVSSTININIITDSSTLCTSEGSFITQKEQRVLGTISTVGRDNGDMASYYTEFGGQYRSDIVSGPFIKEKSLLCAEICQSLIRSPLPPSGRTEVVLDPTLVGFLVHEAVGHAAEADIALGGSCLLGKTGQRVAAESVSITDDPCYLGGPGSYGYDDEGVPARPTALIHEGTFSGFLHNRETAFSMGAEPHGNARAWNFSCEPVIRMSNTYLHPLDHTLEELVEGVHDGYLVTAGHMGGESDYNGEFTIGTGYCQKIEQGALTEERFKGPVITGNAFEVLNHIHAIGNRELFEVRAATCGKTQPAFVGVGGPPIKTHVMFRGRE
jgi:TldD protein